jgi:hypothetical protein
VCAMTTSTLLPAVCCVRSSFTHVTYVRTPTIDVYIRTVDVREGRTGVVVELNTSWTTTRFCR